MNSFGFGTVHIPMHRVQHVQVVLGSLDLRKLLKRLEKVPVEEVSRSALWPTTQEVILLDDRLVHELKIHLQLNVRGAVVVTRQHALTHDSL
jgi:membrane protein YdbS with pleckstrin-like domain